MNGNILKSEMALNELTMREMATKLSLSKSGLYRKLNGTCEFTRLEISKIIKCLNLSEEKTMQIFFMDEVS